MRPAPIARLISLKRITAAFAAFAASACSISLVPRATRADILMVDLDASYEEVTAARAAALKRGEALVVIPDIDSGIRNRIAQEKHEIGLIDGDIDRAREKLERSAADREQPDSRTAPPLSSEIKLLIAEKRPHDDSVGDLTSGVAAVTSTLIRQAVRGIQERSRTLTAIILLGRSDGTRFWGSQWEVTRTQLLAILEEFPVQRESLRSVVFWGCYPAALADAQWWRRSFSMKALMGFKPQMDESPATPALLREVLERESQMAWHSEVRDAAEALKRLSLTTQQADSRRSAAASRTPKALPSSEIHASVSGVSPVPEREAGFWPVRLDTAPECWDADFELRARIPAYSECFAADRTCPHPDRDPARAGIRTLYSSLLHLSHCAPSTRFMRTLPSRSRILALERFDTVRRNFAAYYRSQIELANAALVAEGLKDRLPDFAEAGVSRHALLRAMDRLHEQVQQARVELRRDPALRSVFKQGAMLLHSLECVPARWIVREPDGTTLPAAPEC